jgi:hypothetical protein
VTVSFSKYLPWQAINFLQRSTQFSKTCCRPLISSKFLASELPFHGWKSPKIAWGKIWTIWRCSNGVPQIHFSQAEHRIQFRSQVSPHAMSGLFQPWKGSSEARNFEVINGLQHVFEKWVERCKFIACQRRYLEKVPTGVIRWVHELCKRPSYLYIYFIINSQLFIPPLHCLSCWTWQSSFQRDDIGTQQVRTWNPKTTIWNN